MPTKSKKFKREARAPKPVVERYEVETIFGLEPYAAHEIAARRIGARLARGAEREGRVGITYDGPPATLNELRSAVAVHRVVQFPFARPTGLLGEESLAKLAAEAERVTGKANRKGFKTLSLSAAGRDSAVFRRLSAELCQRLGLTKTEETGDLALAARPVASGTGWEVLLRLTQRPISARPWRVCDMPGALDATVAHVTAALTGPSPRQRFLNIACGSSTMLIERIALGPARRAAGVDTDPAALECSRRNLEAAGMMDQVELAGMDMTAMPFRDATFDAIVGDLPFGMLVRDGRDNALLYPAVLREAARVAAPGAVLALVTTDHDAMREALTGAAELWELVEAVELRIPSNRGYITPAIYVAARPPSR